MVIVLVALAAAEIASLAFVIDARPDGAVSVQPVSENAVTEPMLKISEIRGPMIDSEAAMIVVDESVSSADASVTACTTLPLFLWVFLLIAYAALLVFNFSYTFRQAARPQWFWEALYTALFIIGWYAWDGCRDHPWFPFAVAKLGLIIFAAYLYLLEKKLRETQESLPESAA